MVLNWPVGLLDPGSLLCICVCVCVFFYRLGFSFPHFSLISLCSEWSQVSAFLKTQSFHLKFCRSIKCLWQFHLPLRRINVTTHSVQGLDTFLSGPKNASSVRRLSSCSVQVQERLQWDALEESLYPFVWYFGNLLNREKNDIGHSSVPASHTSMTG